MPNYKRGENSSNTNLNHKCGTKKDKSTADTLQLDNVSYENVIDLMKKRASFLDSVKATASSKDKKIMQQKMQYTKLVEHNLLATLKVSSELLKYIKNIPFDARDKIDWNDILEKYFKSIIEQRESGELMDSSNWVREMGNYRKYYVNKNTVQADVLKHKTDIDAITKSNGCYMHAYKEDEGRKKFADLFLQQIYPAEIGEFVREELPATEAKWRTLIAEYLNETVLPDDNHVSNETCLLINEDNAMHTNVGNVLIDFDVEGAHYSKPTYYANFEALRKVVQDLILQPGRIKTHVAKRDREENGLETFKSRIKPVRLETFHNHGYSTSLEAFKWPDNESILEVQQKHMKVANASKLVQTRRDGLYSLQGSTNVWIPMQALELRVSLCILAHCSLSGHRSIDTTAGNLAEFDWETKSLDVKEFCTSCLQCKQVKGGRTIPRPWGHTITGKRRNHVIAFDYLYVQSAPSSGIHKYVYILVVKDTYSHFVRLYACEQADAATTARALADWLALFGIQKESPPQMLSDCGTHFKNEVIETLAGNFGMEVNHFTTPYCPFANGSVERLNLDVLNLLQLLIAESGVKFEDWYHFLCPIMDILNSYPSKVLDGRSPQEVQMGLERTNILNLVTHIERSDTSVNISLEGTYIGVHVDKLHASLLAMHKAIEITKEQRRDQNRTQRDKIANIANFDRGCFVLHGQVENKIKSKLQVKWLGPYRVTKVLCEQLYEIQNILHAKQVLIAHTSRLKFYSHADMNTSEILKENLAVQESLKFKVKSIVEHKYNAQLQEYQLLIEWTGFSAFDNSWEPFVNIWMDVPSIVSDYVNNMRNNNTDKEQLSQLIQPFKRRINNQIEKNDNKQRHKLVNKKRKAKRKRGITSTNKNK